MELYDFYKGKISLKQYLEILGDGSQRNLLDVSDGIRGIIKLKNHSSKSEIFNLGHSETMSVKDLADIVCKSCQSKN